MFHLPEQMKLTPLSIVLIYTITGVLWAAIAIIFFSEQVSSYLAFIKFETANHIFFILSRP